MNKVCRDSTQTKTQTSKFQIVDFIIYTNEGHNEMVELVDINITNPDSINYRTKFLRGNKMVVNIELLKSRNVTDIGSIPIYSEGYINKLKNIAQEKLRIPCFHNCYHLYNRNLNPYIIIYLTYILNKCLD